MLSGYLCVTKTKMNYKRIMEIYGIQLFYSILFFALSIPFYSVTRRDIYRCFLPLTSRQNWYLTSYFGLFFIIPYVNLALVNLAQKELKRLLIILFLLFSLMPLTSLKFVDLYRTNNGYSFVWLLVMYCFGAYQRMYPKEIKHSLLIYALISLFAYISKMLILVVLNKMNTNFNNYGLYMVLVGYTSPCMILGAYMLLNYFANKKILLSLNLQKIVVFLSAVSFAVFIIHVNQCVEEKFMKSRMEFLANYNPFIFFMGVIIASVGIYIACSLIEGTRLFVFRILKVNILKEKIEDCILYVGQRCIKITNPE